MNSLDIEDDKTRLLRLLRLVKTKYPHGMERVPVVTNLYEAKFPLMVGECPCKLRFTFRTNHAFMAEPYRFQPNMFSGQKEIVTINMGFYATKKNVLLKRMTVFDDASLPSGDWFKEAFLKAKPFNREDLDNEALEFVEDYCEGVLYAS